jgi:group I intron endonuclease
MNSLRNKTGIYMIKNLKNGRIYIGSSSVCLKKRIDHHFRSLKSNKHHSCFLQRDFNKCELGDFIYGVIEFCNPENCIEIEQTYLDMFNPDYNTSPTAGSSYGVKHTLETRKKYSKAKKGKIPWNKGKKVGNYLTKESHEKRLKSLARNNKTAGKKPIRLQLKKNDFGVTFLTMQYCADFIGVNISYVSSKLKDKKYTTIRGYDISKV